MLPPKQPLQRWPPGPPSELDVGVPLVVRRHMTRVYERPAHIRLAAARSPPHRWLRLIGNTPPALSGAFPSTRTMELNRGSKVFSRSNTSVPIRYSLSSCPRPSKLH